MTDAKKSGGYIQLDDRMNVWMDVRMREVRVAFTGYCLASVLEVALRSVETVGEWELHRWVWPWRVCNDGPGWVCGRLPAAVGALPVPSPPGVVAQQPPASSPSSAPPWRVRLPIGCVPHAAAECSTRRRSHLDKHNTQTPNMRQEVWSMGTIHETEVSSSGIA